jgi:hypothetical protein
MEPTAGDGFGATSDDAPSHGMAATSAEATSADAPSVQASQAVQVCLTKQPASVFFSTLTLPESSTSLHEAPPALTLPPPPLYRKHHLQTVWPLMLFELANSSMSQQVFPY